MLTKKEFTERKILEYGNALLRVFPMANERNPRELWRRLHRVEATAQRFAEMYSKGEVEAKEWDRMGQRILTRVHRILGDSEETHSLIIDTSSRGYALKLAKQYMDTHSVDLPLDWEGYGIIAPDV